MSPFSKKYAKKTSSGFYPIPYFISAIKHDYKFKEEHQPQNTEQKSVDKKSEWEKKLQFLQLDLSHWEKLLKYAKTSNNDTQIKTIKSVILKCQEKIEQHTLTQSDQEEAI